MSAQDKKQTEIQKLLHFLQITDVSEFAFLDKLSKDEIHQLRLKIIDVSQFTQTDIWKRLTGVAKFFPNYMNAKISETVMGPLIAANMSYHMPVKDAISIMGYMSTQFLATVAEHMTPENARDLINQIPMAILKKVTTELVQSKKFMTAAGFVDVSDVPRLVELSKIIYKEEDLIRISTFVENKQYIAKIVEGFSDDRMDKIITIAYQHDMQQEVISVFSHLSNKEMQRVLKIVSQLPINLKTTVLKDFEERIK
ncbi:MAG TPA: hypothetical protein PK546_05150 [Chitinophagales bacterium]|jgi:hypothetical protein|nr:hypothetical protein [Chitinophagales bacterium]